MFSPEWENFSQSSEGFIIILLQLAGKIIFLERKSKVRYAATKSPLSSIVSLVRQYGTGCLSAKGDVLRGSER